MADRILVAIDDSAPAQAALGEALRRFGAADLIALHVLDTSESAHGVEGGAAGGWHAAKHEAAETLLADAVAHAAEHDVDLDTAIESGPVAQTIVEYVSDHEIDHVVIGSHARSGISRILIGSVAEHVMRNVPVSVTVARSSS